MHCFIFKNRNSEDNGEHSEGASSPGWEEDYKAWEAKFRCTNFRSTKKHSGGMCVCFLEDFMHFQFYSKKVAIYLMI